MDFTPLLPQMRKYQARAARLLGDRGVVFCLGSRPLLTYAVWASTAPARILGAATTEAEGFALVRQHRPGLLVANDRLERGCGISLVVAVKSLAPATLTLLMVGANQSRRRILAARKARCDALLLETRMGLGHELTALRTICSGDIFIDRRLEETAGAAAGGGDPGGRRQPLSAREIQVLQAAAEGRNNGEIARRLYLSVDTVKTHLHNVLVKLEARDRSHAVAIALGLGWIQLPDLGLSG
ncbi:MAG: response regulator transcription factor [Synechococcaceae cyanobacterium]|nr:response regulator transcription factor [Synechococcaceae cyanobacterium]